MVTYAIATARGFCDYPAFWGERIVMTPRPLAGWYALGQWFGETCVGLIPLLAYSLIHSYSAPTYRLMVCSGFAEQANKFVPNCTALAEGVSQEICILTVVISGLALLSLFNLGRHQRKAPHTWWTRLLIVLCILSLLAGAILYALIGVHLDRGVDGIIWWVLFAALLSSLCLALEGAILDA